MTGSSSETRFPWLALVIGLLAGLAGGLYYAWFLNPVQFVNVSPDRLSIDTQQISLTPDEKRGGGKITRRWKLENLPVIKNGETVASGWHDSRFAVAPNEEFEVGTRRLLPYRRQPGGDHIPGELHDAHALVADFGASTGWLVGLYVMLVLIAPQGATMVAAAGYADGWVNFRARARARRSGSDGE